MNSESSKPKTTSWLLVLSLLIGLPVIFSLALRFWLGVPSETHQVTGVFGRLQLQEVPLLEKHTLRYGNLFFCRLRLQAEGVKPFYDQLRGFESSAGRAEPPISLKLEREWWDPSETESGTYWRYGKVTLWSPEPYPDLVYGVVREGEVEPGTNNEP